jgi:hypothetical protein
VQETPISPVFNVKMFSCRPISNFVRFLLLPAFLGGAGKLVAEDFQGSTQTLPYDEDLIAYNSKTPHDAVAQLQANVAGGKTKLKWDEQFGWLPSVLKQLRVPKSSQMLVFSRTSMQRQEINPQNPRAIFFNDDVYVGYIPHAPKMEISAVDPKLGGIFYSVEQEPGDKPTFTRNQDCLQCHVSARTLGVPGHFMRSLQTDGSGEIKAGTDAHEVTQCTPLAERWGGWYVTGQHGSQTHLGNLIGLSAFERHASEPSFRGNVTDLSELLDVSKYPKPQSDILALMVLEHQAHMHNYITRLNYETQIMMSMYGHIRYLRHQEDAFLRYLLFTEEAPLTAPVCGNPQFVSDFTASARRDSKGRSLRDLDLQTRLFKYPCSFLIYSDSFDQIPSTMRDDLLQRLYDILTGKDKVPQFAGLAANDRQAILEILRETKSNLPVYWNADLKQ